MDEFWETDTETPPRAVDVYMTKLAGYEEFEIKTVHGDRYDTQKIYGSMSGQGNYTEC